MNSQLNKEQIKQKLKLILNKNNDIKNNFHKSGI